MGDQAQRGRREICADRVQRFSAPPFVLYKALTRPTWGRWLRLRPKEVLPQVLHAKPELRVVWSSLWPVSPDDTIEFDLSPHDSGTAVRFRWFSTSPPDARG